MTQTFELIAASLKNFQQIVQYLSFHIDQVLSWNNQISTIVLSYGSSIVLSPVGLTIPLCWSFSDFSSKYSYPNAIITIITECFYLAYFCCYIAHYGWITDDIALDYYIGDILRGNIDNIHQQYCFQSAKLTIHIPRMTLHK